MAKIEGAALAELPGIEAPKRGRGRPKSAKPAKSAAERKAAQRVREKAAQDSRASLVEGYSLETLWSVLSPYAGMETDQAAQAAWEEIGWRMGWF